MFVNSIHLRSTEDVIDSSLRIWPAGPGERTVETSSKRRVQDTAEFECIIWVYFSATPRAVQEIVGLLMRSMRPGTLWLNLDRETGQWRYTLQVLEDQTIQALPTERDPHWMNTDEQPGCEGLKPDSFWMALQKDLLFGAFINADGSRELCEVRKSVPALSTGMLT